MQTHSRYFHSETIRTNSYVNATKLRVDGSSLSASSSIHQYDVAHSPRWLSDAVPRASRSATITTDTFVFRVFLQQCGACSKVCARPGSVPGGRGLMGLLRPYGGPFSLVRPTWAIVGSCYSCWRTNSTSRKSFPCFVPCTQSFSIQIG